MTIFHHPFTDIEKLSIVTPFEPDKFPFISRPRITLHIGGQRQREISFQAISNQMINAGRQMWGKMEFQKLLSSPLQEIWVSKSKVKLLEREHKKNVEEKWIKKKPRRKNRLKWKWRETRKEDQSRIGPLSDEKWSLVWSPWNTIWAYLPFLSKPWTLTYITYLESLFWSNVDT